MTYSVKVENGVVVDRIKGEKDDYISNGAAQIKWTYTDGKFSAPPSDFTPVPTELTINRVQFKSMLALLGKSTDDVMKAIDAVITDPTQNIIAKVKVTDSDRYARDNELFTILTPPLNLTDAEIDAAWMQALLI